MMPRRFPFRTLISVYMLAVVVAACEFFAGSRMPQNASAGYEDPIGRFPKVMGRLYPGSSTSEYILGRWHEEMAVRRIENDDSLSLSQVMAELQAESREAAQHYERAINLGLRSEEYLAYHYALSLVRSRADPARIDRAIATWRRDFPYSNLPDLDLRRKEIEKHLQSPED